MTFNVAAAAYGRFMGRYSAPLAAEFLRWSEVPGAERALDVGCGPGALTAELVQHLGEDAVSAVDPSAPFIAALRARFPTVDVHQASAEELPFPDRTFAAALAQLVVPFMTEPVQGLAEMARVTRSGGVLAACVWDHAGGRSPLSAFWRAVSELDPYAVDESQMPGTRDGDLVRLCEEAGWSQLQRSTLTVAIEFASFQDWWDPFTLGVGPAGAYVGRLDPTDVEQLKSHCATLLPSAPFRLSASVWAVRGMPRG